MERDGQDLDDSPVLVETHPQRGDGLFLRRGRRRSGPVGPVESAHVSAAARTREIGRERRDPGRGPCFERRAEDLERVVARALEAPDDEMELRARLEDQERADLGVVRGLEEEHEVADEGVVDGEVEIGRGTRVERELDRAGFRRQEVEAVVHVRSDLVDVSLDEEMAPGIERGDVVGMIRPVVGFLLAVDRRTGRRLVMVVAGAGGGEREQEEEPRGAAGGQQAVGTHGRSHGEAGVGVVVGSTRARAVPPGLRPPRVSPAARAPSLSSPAASAEVSVSRVFGAVAQSVLDMTTARFQSRPGGDPGPKVHVVTFGCQMNKYDSLFVEGRFKKQGWQTTEKLEEADVVLFNTCSVRDHAEERAWSWVGELKRAKKTRPELVIGVMGCMAQRVEQEIFRRAGHVDLVAGTRQFHLLPELVEEVRERRAHPERWREREMRILATDMRTQIDGNREGEEYTGGRQGYLAVMRGCDLSCTYCIVPKTRGRVASRPVDELVAEARWMISQGAQVITLLGQTVNSYGEDFDPPATGAPHGRGRAGRTGLPDLLHHLQELDGLERIRLVTLHPSYVTSALARAIADCDKVDRFLPLPAQSGSDEVLKRMKRGYTGDLYRRRVAILRESVPDIELSSDWIVGFCGESDADFEASLALLDEIGFAQSYVFQYDPRPDTTAAERLQDDVPREVKKARHAAMLERAEHVQRARLARFRGRVVPAFLESVSERDSRILLGHTIHGLPVSVRAGPELVGRTTSLHVQETTAFGMAASPVE